MPRRKNRLPFTHSWALGLLDGADRQVVDPHVDLAGAVVDVEHQPVDVRPGDVDLAAELARQQQLLLGEPLGRLAEAEQLPLGAVVRVAADQDGHRLAGVLRVALARQDQAAEQLDARPVRLHPQPQVQLLGDRGARQVERVVDVRPALDLKADVLAPLPAVGRLVGQPVLDDLQRGVAAAGLPERPAALEAVLVDVLAQGGAGGQEHESE
jgi:hypothetical protein